MACSLNCVYFIKNCDKGTLSKSVLRFNTSLKNSKNLKKVLKNDFDDENIE